MYPAPDLDPDLRLDLILVWALHEEAEALAAELGPPGPPRRSASDRCG